MGMGKICSKCEIEKDLDCFGRDSNNSDGKRYYCKKCAVIQSQNRQNKLIQSGICSRCAKHPLSKNNKMLCMICADKNNQQSAVSVLYLSALLLGVKSVMEKVGFLLKTLA